MDALQIDPVRTTWAKLVPIADQAASLFYNRQFEIDPSVRSLFTGDMKDQGKLLVGMVDTAVKGLDDLDSIVPVVLRDWACVTPATVSKALITPPWPPPSSGPWDRAWAATSPKRSKAPGSRPTSCWPASCNQRRPTARRWYKRHTALRDLTIC